MAIPWYRHRRRSPRVAPACSPRNSAGGLNGYDQARLGYLDFVRADVGLPSVWDDLKGQIYLGSEAFIERMQSNVSPGQSLDEIPRKQCRPPAKPLALYRADFAVDPRTGMALAYLTGDYAMKAIADAFDVHYTTVSRAVRAYESKQDQK